ncbi:hypothetical protein N7G274_002765 [Stereocaulon virgatum]|uniref:Uncharacterized protein n=1 Tax=Stereocaulon virgatum TaxID=373712 RepID=A0ABR4AGW0_9LECA
MAVGPEPSTCFLYKDEVHLSPASIFMSYVADRAPPRTKIMVAGIGRRWFVPSFNNSQFFLQVFVISFNKLNIERSVSPLQPLLSPFQSQSQGLAMAQACSPVVWTMPSLHAA